MPLPPTRHRPSASAPRWLGLAGPTAAGKTAAAFAIAESLASTRQVEIVSVDSALVYRGMDIGTAKPTPSERAQVPHHLIDILDPAESYSAARFAAEASQRIDEITGRGHLPLLVGGTMLYFKALIEGIDAMPAADADVRKAIEHEAALTGWPALHAELATVDPLTANRLAPGDTQRIQRALEVFRISGQPLSSFHRQPSPEHAPPTLISLEPADRTWLHERIAKRFSSMLADGLIDEVRGLHRRGDLHAELPSMRCVGYRQVWQALDAQDLSGLQERAVAATRQLAKRQMTWLRSMPWRQTVACDSADALTRVVDLARASAAATLR